MRTTVRLDEGLLREAKAEASRKGETVTALSRGAEDGWREVVPGGPGARITFTVSRATGASIWRQQDDSSASGTGSTGDRDSSRVTSSCSIPARKPRSRRLSIVAAERRQREAAYGISPQVWHRPRIGPNRGIRASVQRASACLLHAILEPNTHVVSLAAPLEDLHGLVEVACVGNLVQDAWGRAGDRTGCEGSHDRDYAASRPPVAGAVLRRAALARGSDAFASLTRLDQPRVGALSTL